VYQPSAIILRQSGEINAALYACWRDYSRRDVEINSGAGWKQMPPPQTHKRRNQKQKTTMRTLIIEPLSEREAFATGEVIRADASEFFMMAMVLAVITNFDPRSRPRSPKIRQSSSVFSRGRWACR
jgi:hypothetical protein